MDRAISNQKLFHVQVQRGEEEVAVASTRLAHRLRLDPVVRIHPVTPWVGPINLVDLNVPPEELVQAGVRRVPKWRRGAAIAVAETRYRRERARPLLPTLWAGFSGGGFGGGSNLVPPFLGNFGGRTDFDVRALLDVPEPRVRELGRSRSNAGRGRTGGRIPVEDDQPGAAGSDLGAARIDRLSRTDRGDEKATEERQEG